MDDAAKLVDESASREADHQSTWKAHQVASEDWEAAGERARSEVGRQAQVAALRQGVEVPVSSDRGLVARRDAAEAFERENPPPRFDEEVTPRDRLGQMVAAVRGTVAK